MTIAEVLLRCSLFSCMGEEELQRIVPLCTRLAAADGATFFRQGQPARSLYVLESGKAGLELSVQRPDGYGYANPTMVALLAPGEAFGWSAVVPPHIMTLSAHSVGPSNVLLVDGQALREMLQRHRDMGYTFMAGLSQLLAERLMQTRETLIYERGWAVRV
ncbi:MAG: cyclic nucleotide-binding domain-containing protein [Chloroflexi bacterium]|nr:cyclic nucleotide-binding domain-containing protein [Chloroflexota bacterium]